MHMQLPLIMKKAVVTGISNALDAYEDYHLWEEEMKSDDEDCKNAEYMPSSWDAEEDVTEEDLDKLFNGSSESNFEGF